MCDEELSRRPVNANSGDVSFHRFTRGRQKIHSVCLDGGRKMKKKEGKRKREGRNLTAHCSHWDLTSASLYMYILFSPLTAFCACLSIKVTNIVWEGTRKALRQGRAE